MNSKLIFTWKLLCMGICITSGFAAIVHFSNFPIFGVLYYIMLVELCFAYTIVYEKAFKVPDLMTNVRSRLRLPTRSVRDKAQRNVLYKQLRSIPVVENLLCNNWGEWILFCKAALVCNERPCWEGGRRRHGEDERTAPDLFRPAEKCALNFKLIVAKICPVGYN